MAKEINPEDAYIASKEQYDASIQRLEELAKVMGKLLDVETFVAGMESTLTSMYESLLSILSNYQKMESEAIRDRIPARNSIFDLKSNLEKIGYEKMEKSIIDGKTGEKGTNYWGEQFIDGQLRPFVAKEIDRETDNRDKAARIMKTLASLIFGGPL